MSANGYLMAAYGATWAIHIAYILYLGARARRTAEDIRELESADRPAGDRK